ncbi:glutaminyl-peptide cyclotransferase [Flavobacterium facile]|uniref:glutaminyl-peptide cyclotransferase n=1 Tax=Flavobacterium facile TaxID=2893174 RepID=UPI002E770D64|nr:glutaminyl-peptide cyclotransferase [Flavobacterium sp. T-12]
MKKINLLIITSLSALLYNCGNTEKLFSIASKDLKQVYKPNESVNLSVENAENTTIDSVVYYSNDIKLGTSANNKIINFKLDKLQFGVQDIKAVVYYEGQNVECLTSFELISNITPKLYETKDYTILNTYNHDSNAYTQGLEFYNGTLLEGTGQNGESTLRKTDYKSGNVSKSIPLSPDYFGEGITVFNGKIYQLTWKNKVGFIYNADTFVQEKTFNYFADIEGWGLTHNDKHLIMSDGTNKIYFLNPETQKLARSINVYSDTNAISELNELEWIDGKIWANIYQKDAVVIINPENGAVEAVIDFSALKTKNKKTLSEGDQVLNGIAFNPTTKTVFVTGKDWDKMFEIKLK